MNDVPPLSPANGHALVLLNPCMLPPPKRPCEDDQKVEMTDSPTLARIRLALSRANARSRGEVL